MYLLAHTHPHSQADSSNNIIRRIALPSGNVTTLAGGEISGYADGQGTIALFLTPAGVALSGDASFALVVCGKGR